MGSKNIHGCNQFKLKKYCKYSSKSWALGVELINIEMYSRPQLKIRGLQYLLMYAS
jgi:hypothetical protein